MDSTDTFDAALMDHPTCSRTTTRLPPTERAASQDSSTGSSNRQVLEFSRMNGTPSESTNFRKAGSEEYPNRFIAQVVPRSGVGLFDLVVNMVFTLRSYELHAS